MKSGPVSGATSRPPETPAPAAPPRVIIESGSLTTYPATGPANIKVDIPASTPPRHVESFTNAQGQQAFRVVPPRPAAEGGSTPNRRDMLMVCNAIGDTPPSAGTSGISNAQQVDSQWSQLRNNAGKALQHAADPPAPPATAPTAHAAAPIPPIQVSF